MDPSLASYLFWFRGALLAILMLFSVVCIVVGAVVFAKQSRYLIKLQEPGSISVGRNGFAAEFKTATGFCLVLAGLVSGHLAARTPIHITTRGLES